MQLRRIALPLLLTIALPAYAELGGDPLPAPSSASSPSVVRQMNRVERFTVQAQQLPTGTAVREYVAPSGKVFAVVWEGPVLPDLQQLLGNYFPQYFAVANSGKAGRGPLTIEQPDLVVQSSGRMRAFFGKAYVPQLLPQGVSMDEIQ